MRRYRGRRVSRSRSSWCVAFPGGAPGPNDATRARSTSAYATTTRSLPEVDELRGWLDAIAADDSGPTTIRSAALFPRAAARFEAAGFEVADRLVLLRADLHDSGVRAAVDGRGDRATRTMHRHHLGAAAAIDRAAFGAEWGHDAKELAEICRATPVHAARHRVAAPRRLGASGPRDDRLRHRRGVGRARLPPASGRRPGRSTARTRAGADCRRSAVDDAQTPPGLPRQHVRRQCRGVGVVRLDGVHADGRTAHRPPRRRSLAPMSVPFRRPTTRHRRW